MQFTRIFQRICLASAVLITTASVAATRLDAQDTSSPLADQLKTQYKLAKVRLDSSGWTVTQPGTVLVVQKGEILGVPPANLAMGNSTYKDGDLKGPTAGAKMFLGNATRYFTVGEKVYVIRIDVHAKNDKVTFTIVECDACNGVQQASTYKSQVTFQFPKDYLSKADGSQVADVINQVLTPDTGGQQQSQQADNSQQQQPATPAPAAQAEPATVEIGQTVDQVTAVLGKPEKIVKAGSKQIYLYKDLKITFVDGKVTDVQ
jgi:hypothetical protein